MCFVNEQLITKSRAESSTEPDPFFTSFQCFSWTNKDWAERWPQECGSGCRRTPNVLLTVNVSSYQISTFFINTSQVLTTLTAQWYLICRKAKCSTWSTSSELFNLVIHMELRFSTCLFKLFKTKCVWSEFKMKEMLLSQIVVRKKILTFE